MFLAKEMIARMEKLESRIGSIMSQEKSDIRERLTKPTKKPANLSELEDFVEKRASNDMLGQRISAACEKHFTQTVNELSRETMKALEGDYPYIGMSDETKQMIRRLAEELGKNISSKVYQEMMQAVQSEKENGGSIQNFLNELAKLPHLQRDVARDLSQNNMPTIYSQAQSEAFQQSPIVVGKVWEHNQGGANSRSAHVSLSGTEIGLNEFFRLNGYQAKYPRDPSLPPSERYKCRCTMRAVREENLSREQKELRYRERLERLKVEPDITAWVTEPILVSTPETRRARIGNFKEAMQHKQRIRDLKEYHEGVERVTGVKVTEQQMKLLRAALKLKPFEKLTVAQTEESREEFSRIKNKLIKEWEEQTGQVWPRYEQDVYSRKGKVIREEGDYYDAHHLIECTYGGPNVWWNIHPARFPDQHQRAIHGKNGVAKKVFPTKRGT